MANVKGSLLNNQGNAPAVKAPLPLAAALSGVATKKRFEEMLGKKAPGFCSSLLTVVNNNSLLQKASTASILAAAGKAAALDLPIEPSLGQAYIVPYKGQAAFQLGYRGAIQLAQRTNIVEKIIMRKVFDGQFVSWDPFVEEFEYDLKGKKSDVVVGYYAYFKLKNGFTKTDYWTKEEVTAHAKRFSKSFNNGPWQTDFDAMACKTVLLSILKTYCPMSIEMQDAIVSDGRVAVVNDAGEEKFEDIQDAEIIETPEGQVVDAETGELFPKE